MADGLHVVVRNTFLEFSDDTTSLDDDQPEPRRVRAFSDITDSKLPVKVELSNNQGFYQMSRHRVASSMQDGGAGGGGGGTGSGAGEKTRKSSGLPTVSEEPGESYGCAFDAYGGLLPTDASGRPHPGMRSMGPPGDLGGGWMPPMGAWPGGVMPPFPPGAASMGWPGYGLGGPALPPPPFPPGMMGGPFGYGGAAPYGHHMQEQGGKKGGRRSQNLQLSEHLAGDAQAPGGRGGKAKGVGSQAAAASKAAPAEMVCNVPPGEQTTVMMRNVPNGYTRGMLLELLNTRGFEGHYDFVYLPMDFRNGVNLGYAFVNLLTNKDAVELTNSLQDFSDWVSDSSKVCEVSWAHPHQGLKEHVERYRNSPVMHASMPDEYKPMVFRNGVQQPFPHPTKAIKAPKLRLTARDGRAQEEGGSPMQEPVAACA